MGELELRGLSTNTRVVIASDHGKALGQPWELLVEALFWELTHVPLVLHYPGLVPAGARVERPVANAVIPAAVLDLLGADESRLPDPPSAAFGRRHRLKLDGPTLSPN